MRAIRSFSLFLVLFVSASVTGATRDYVRETFVQKDFHPHVYDDSEIVIAYGPGIISKSDYDISRSYYDDNSKLWVTFTGDADQSEKYRTISEIIVSTPGPAGNKYLYRGDLNKIFLFGLSISSPEKDVVRVAKTKYGYKKKKVVFFKRNFDEVMFHPSSDNTNTYYRYLIEDGKVVALAIGITE